MFEHRAGRAATRSTSARTSPARCAAPTSSTRRSRRRPASDPDINLRRFECLGACDIAPMVSVDQRLLRAARRSTTPQRSSTTCAPAASRCPSWRSRCAAAADPATRDASAVSPAILLRPTSTSRASRRSRSTSAAAATRRCARRSTMEPDAIVARDRSLGPARPRRRRLPDGRKVSFLPKGDMDKYLVCNADESEPGTFKDRELMQKSPAHADRGGRDRRARRRHHARLHLHPRRVRGAGRRSSTRRSPRRAPPATSASGSSARDFSLDVVLHRGAGAYICGEETGLLDSLEGKRGNPRLKPPFPAIQGLYQGPTLINNVETLSTMPHDHPHGRRRVRQARRARARRAPSSSRSPATCSGPATTRSSSASPRARSSSTSPAARRRAAGQALVPGGSSSPVLTGADLDIPYDFDSLAKAGTMLGSGAIIVVDDSTPVLDVALQGRASSTATSPAASARRAARAPTGR